MGDFCSYVGQAIDLFRYDPRSPMLFSSGLFLFVFLGFSLIYGLLKRRLTLRIVYVTLFSLYFYYKTSGLFFLLLVGLSLSDFAIGRLMHRSRRSEARKSLLVLSLLINLGLLCYFKYADLIVSAVAGLIDRTLTLPDIFLPVGISFFTFQSMSYVIDLYRRQIEPVRRWIDYLFYLSFFPQLVAGPIVRARDFLPQIYRNPVFVSRDMFGRGVFLILSGLFKKAIISDYISLNFVDRVFDNPMLYSGFENLMGVYGYALQIYCDFSGYSDMAIGLALLLGFRFPVNFDSPYQSATITEFWRRWHISLSSWLKDYLYISLGGNRKGRARTYANLMLTMLLGGLWHGAAVRFILWGALHGAALAVHKALMHAFPSVFKASGEQMRPWRRVLGVLVTFHVVCLGWILFRAPDMQTGERILSQIFGHFQWRLIPQGRFRLRGRHGLDGCGLPAAYAAAPGRGVGRADRRGRSARCQGTDADRADMVRHADQIVRNPAVYLFPVLTGIASGESSAVRCFSSHPFVFDRDVRGDSYSCRFG